MLLAAGALALASIGGMLIVNADSGSGKEGIQERAAEILGVETSDFPGRSSRRHIKKRSTPRSKRLIDSAVEDGDITESEATEIRDWLADQPELTGMNGLRGKFGLMWLHNSGTSKAGAILEKLVEADKITEDEVTAYTEWLEERPDAIDELLPTIDKGDRGRFKRHWRGKRGYDCGEDKDGESSEKASWDKVNKST